MDTAWAFRASYNKACTLVHRQDKFCAAVKKGRWSSIRGQNFPKDLEWEALADVIRGKVKVHTHCYEAVDFNGIARLTNEFKFSIAAFHHAHEAYLMPEPIKKAWGKTPALFQYKRERRLEALNLQHRFCWTTGCMFLSSITTTLAEVLGLDHCIGYLRAEAAAAVKYEGLPPLIPQKQFQNVIFQNVNSVWFRVDGKLGIEKTFSAQPGSVGTVVVQNGKITCTGSCENSIEHGYTTLDLVGGSLSPGLTTKDGDMFDPLTGSGPSILGGDSSVIREEDGLQLAYISGIMTAITAPAHSGVFSGSPSVSTQIATLRRLLFGGGKSGLEAAFAAVTDGDIPLVVSAESANVIATLIHLKKEVEIGKALKLTISGAAEAHLLAAELGATDVGVILSPVRLFPSKWQQRRILPKSSTHGTKRRFSVDSSQCNCWTCRPGSMDSRNARFDAAWVALEAGLLDKHALSLVSSNLEKLLGAEVSSEEANPMAYYGGDIFEK
ncbi:hypothetical protein BU17DRAFT_68372 [Hysterangium stoloniferum]|nr:hypothetical protein BU17DRAFT_68372 [Hysterangium stoloniferum]